MIAALTTEKVLLPMSSGKVLRSSGRARPELANILNIGNWKHDLGAWPALFPSQPLKIRPKLTVAILVRSMGLFEGGPASLTQVIAASTSSRSPGAKLMSTALVAISASSLAEAVPHILAILTTSSTAAFCKVETLLCASGVLPRRAKTKRAAPRRALTSRRCELPGMAMAACCDGAQCGYERM